MNDFRGKKAWFSSSVHKECKQVWGNGGGKTESNIQCADYIFADNPSVPDMLRFYKSRLYLDKGIQPFNSAWLLDVDQNILDYILYPEDFKEAEMFEKEVSNPAYHRGKTVKSVHTQDSENAICLDRDEVLLQSNHKSLQDTPKETTSESNGEWNFEDERESPTFHRLKDYRISYPQKKQGTGFLEHEKAFNLSYQGLKTPEIEIIEQSCLEGEGSSPTFNTLKHLTKSNPQDGDDTRCVDDDKIEVLTPEPLNNSKKLETTPKEGRGMFGLDVQEYKNSSSSVQDEGLFNDTDSSSLKTEEDAAMVLPNSISLCELEIPNHVFHSSMHDGFTRIEDIKLPKGLKLQDFFIKDDKGTTPEYQVYLKYPPSQVPHKT